MLLVRSFAVPSLVLLGGLVALLACSGADKQAVLSSEIGTSTSSGNGSSSGNTTSGSTGASGSTTSTSSSSGDPIPPDPGNCAQEEEDNDVPGAANDFIGSICGTLLLDNDTIDYLTFDVPVTATSTSFGYDGNVRVFLSGPGTEDREIRTREDLPPLLPGSWRVRIQPERGRKERIDWMVRATAE